MLPKIISFSDSFFLPTYGVLVALGFLAGLWIAGRLARRSGLDPEAVTNLGVYAALAGLAGAKLFMFVVEFGHYRANPAEIFSLATLQAGGVFYGGLVAALLYGAWHVRRHGLPTALTLDCFAPGLALGQAIGRLGCFAAGCCWGQACDRSWAVTFTNPDAHALTGVPLDVALHPTQLYEAAMLGAAFAITYIAFARPHKPGAILGLYLLLAAIERFTVDFVRAHQQPNPFEGPLTTAQWIALGLAAAGVWLLVRAGEPPKPELGGLKAAAH
ncbi:MAG: prolipoprotein diacylglyceryl transferase [Bryobacteraceae bacterium]